LRLILPSAARSNVIIANRASQIDSDDFDLE
jgi:hypothetical protein